MGLERKKLFLFEIFHQIQDELHDDLKQLVEAKYNNKLEYVMFIKMVWIKWMRIMRNCQV